MRRWTKQEIHYVEDNYMKMKYSKIAKKLGRTENSIGQEIHKLKLRKTKVIPKGLVKTCEYCGKIIEKDKLPYNMGLEAWYKVRYCSISCMDRDRKIKGLFKFCKYCGKKIERDKLTSYICLKTWNNVKYCSYSCSNKNRRIKGLVKFCEYCNKKMERDKMKSNPHLKAFNNMKFCSRSCSAKARYNVRRIQNE